MIFFLLLSLFIVPHCYGAEFSVAKEKCFFLPADKECAQLINAFKAVQAMPTVTRDDKIYFFSNLPRWTNQQSVLRKDFETRLQSLRAKTYRFDDVLKKSDEFNVSGFVCIKVKPIQKVLSNIPKSPTEYSCFLDGKIEIVPVDISSGLVINPQSEVDFLKNYFTQKNMINSLSEQLKGREEEKNKLLSSVNDLNQQKISLGEEKTRLEEQLQTVNAEKQKVEQQLFEKIKNAEAQVADLQKNLEILNEDKQRLEEQLAQQISNAGAQAAELQEKLKVMNQEKQRLEGEINAKNKESKKQLDLLTKEKNIEIEQLEKEEQLLRLRVNQLDKEVREKTKTHLQDLKAEKVRFEDLTQEKKNVEQEVAELTQKLKAVNEEKETLRKLLAQEKKNVEQEVAELTQKLKAVNEEKQSLEAQLMKEKQSAEQNVVGLKAQLKIVNEQKEELNKMVSLSQKKPDELALTVSLLSQQKRILEEKSAMLEQQLTEEKTNAQRRVENLSNKLKKLVLLINKPNSLTEHKQNSNILLEEDIMFEEDKMPEEDIMFEESDESIEEQMLKATEIFVQLNADINNFKKESNENITRLNAENARLQIQLNESGIMPKLKKISKWKALGVTVLGLLISILGYNRQALKNIDVQSCLKWVKESCVRFSDFVQLHYLLLEARLRT